MVVPVLKLSPVWRRGAERCMFTMFFTLGRHVPGGNSASRGPDLQDLVLLGSAGNLTRLPVVSSSTTNFTFLFLFVFGPHPLPFWTTFKPGLINVCPSFPLLF